MEFLLIDGYNVINAWNDIFMLEREALEDSREKFLNILSNFQGYKKNNIIVVFDAHMVKGSKRILLTI
jgi:predicted RNA-binding protein with PIN domain